MVRDATEERDGDAKEAMDRNPKGEVDQDALEQGNGDAKGGDVRG